MRYEDAPGTPDAWKGSGRVMHGQVTIGTGTLMASDFPPGMEGDAQKGVSVMQTFPTAEDARAAFDRLSQGGAMIQDFGPTFFSPGFGMLKDRFGTHWILSAEAEADWPAPDARAEAEAEAHPT
jgi:PhnB protein